MILALTILLGSLPAAVRADNPEFDPADPKGKPASYKVGSGKYAVWHDTEGWHFRATASKDGQEFTGRIDAVDGGFVSMRNVATTAKGPKSPPAKMLPIKSKGFAIKLTLAKGSESGFDIVLDDKATAIKFALEVDGQKDEKLILIGAKGVNPKGAEFSFPPKPGKATKK
jgi:hypothetical protein